MFDKLDKAMDTILKADPAKVKADTAADKQARSRKRLKKGAIFVRERGQSPVVAAFVHRPLTHSSSLFMQ